MPMMVKDHILSADDIKSAVPIHLVGTDDIGRWRDGAPSRTRGWAEANGFKGEKDQVLLVPAENGALDEIVLGVGAGLADEGDPWAFSRLAGRVPEGAYRIAGSLPPGAAYHAALGWALGQYSFDRYRTKNGDTKPRCLIIPDGADFDRVARLVDGTTLVRDLINTPTSDMGPDELEDAVRDVAGVYGAGVDSVVGEELLAQNFPLIHAVGRASEHAPRLIDLTWGNADHPRLTLVGKGVCFDTGGLDLKPSSAMRLMKKDMGGAAHALALAGMVMDGGLPVRLRLLIPAVENSVSANAFRPGDIITSRNGISVEIDNTDAEGRLVLADALALGAEEVPDLMLDFATLTGAARVALGGDIPPFFTDSHDLARALADYSVSEAEPVWRMPLWMPYMDDLKSKVADIVNSAPSGFAGAITAALFLKRFVKDPGRWAHFDVYGWNKADRPGRPAGGEAMALRTVYRMIENRYPRKGP